MFILNAVNFIVNTMKASSQCHITVSVIPCHLCFSIFPTWTFELQH